LCIFNSNSDNQYQNSLKFWSQIFWPLFLQFWLLGIEFDRKIWSFWPGKELDIQRRRSESERELQRKASGKLFFLLPPSFSIACLYFPFFSFLLYLTFSLSLSLSNYLFSPNLPSSLSLTFVLLVFTYLIIFSDLLSIFLPLYNTFVSP